VPDIPDAGLTFELRLPLAPYRFEWSGEAAVECRSRHTPSFDEEYYVHADGSVVIIRNYAADCSFHVLSDRGEIRLIDNANDYRSALSVSVVLLP
jgi:hypothetical protein